MFINARPGVPTNGFEHAVSVSVRERIDDMSNNAMSTFISVTTPPVDEWDTNYQRFHEEDGFSYHALCPSDLDSKYYCDCVGTTYPKVTPHATQMQYHHHRQESQFKFQPTYHYPVQEIGSFKEQSPSRENISLRRIFEGYGSLTANGLELNKMNSAVGVPGQSSYMTSSFDHNHIQHGGFMPPVSYGTIPSAISSSVKTSGLPYIPDWKANSTSGPWPITYRGIDDTYKSSIECYASHGGPLGYHLSPEHNTSPNYDGSTWSHTTHLTAIPPKLTRIVPSVTSVSSMSSHSSMQTTHERDPYQGSGNDVKSKSETTLMPKQSDHHPYQALPKSLLKDHTYLSSPTLSDDNKARETRKSNTCRKPRATRTQQNQAITRQIESRSRKLRKILPSTSSQDELCTRAPDPESPEAEILEPEPACEHLPLYQPGNLPSSESLQVEQTRKEKLEYLVQMRSAGMSYKKIREEGGFTEAESTLRGRYRIMTKKPSQRVRNPEWTVKDLELLKQAVKKHTKRDKVYWKKAGEYIVENGGSYHFGAQTVRRKWDELQL